MAITGSYSTSTGVNLNLVATYSYTQDVSANTSTVNVKLYLRHSSLYASSLSGSYLSVAGNSVSYSKTISYSGSVMDRLLAEKTVVVAHNNSGVGSCAIKATFVFNGTYSNKYIGTLTINETLSLKTIPRSSGLSVPTSINTGSSLKVTISPSDSTFKHKVAFIIDGATKYTSDFIAAGTTSLSYSIAHSWSSNKSSKAMTVRLYTYNSSNTLIASTDKSVTINVPESIIPTISSVSASVSSGLDGKYVQGKSKVSLTVNAKPGDGSSITNYEFKGNNISGSTASHTMTSTDASVVYTSSIIQTSETVTYQVRVKDARGRYSSWKTVDICVYKYSAPVITSIQAQRCLKDGTLDNNGTYAKVTIKTSHSSINGANAGTVVLSNSKDSITLTRTSTSDANTYSEVYGSDFDIDESYTILATLKDEYNASDSKSAPLKAAQRSLNIAKYGNGVAIGGMSTVDKKDDAGQFECNWNASFTDNVNIAGLLNCSGVVQTKGMTLIPHNADFNSYIAPGTYLINSNAIAETVANRPTAESGVLVVYHCAGSKYDGYPWSYVNQEYTTIGGTTYHRTISTGAEANIWSYGTWGIKSGRFMSSLGNTGYQKLPTGLIVAWGECTISHPSATYATATVTFPITFPNAIVVAIGYNATRAFHCAELFPNSSRSGGTIYLSTNSGGSLGQGYSSSCRYFVAGY